MASLAVRPSKQPAPTMPASVAARPTRTQSQQQLPRPWWEQQL